LRLVQSLFFSTLLWLFLSLFIHSFVRSLTTYPSPLCSIWCDFCAIFKESNKFGKCANQPCRAPLSEATCKAIADADFEDDDKYYYCDECMAFGNDWCHNCGQMVDPHINTCNSYDILIERIDEEDISLTSA
jgi:hypothetical protein